jgi:outer membrane translocation and assembly module TamA
VFLHRKQLLGGNSCCHSHGYQRGKSVISPAFDMATPCRSFSRLVGGLVVVFGLIACQPKLGHGPEPVPGDTDWEMRKVEIRAKGPNKLHVDTVELLKRMGLRKRDAIYTARPYNPFRQAEDKRRIRAYWETEGYFDVHVDEPVVDKRVSDHSVAISWTVEEGERYRLSEITFKSCPPAFQHDLESLVPSNVGDGYNLEAMRKARYEMAEYLQRKGYSHARVISRTFVVREKKEIHWYYYVDTGPLTVVGKVDVRGNYRIPADVILKRAGLVPGEPFSLIDKEKAEFDLLDTGAFASVSMETNADAEFYRSIVPDSGGLLSPEQVDQNGNLVPRKLPETIDIKISVVESPTKQIRLEGSVQADPTRIDALATGRVWFRNLFGPMHHVTFETSLGYGYFWREQDDVPQGIYGSVLARYVRPGLFGRLGDFRWTMDFRDRLFPSFHLREVHVGPGIRSALATNLYFDFDAFLRIGRNLKFGPFTAAQEQEHHLPSQALAYGAELSSSLIWDERDDRIEATRGHLLAFRSTFAPGAGLSTHRYWLLNPEIRYFFHLSTSWSVGLKGNASWVTAYTEKGVPLGPRLFGGGAFGLRGFGRDRMSPNVSSCTPNTDGTTACHDELVGGLSMVESSVELRFLPPLQTTGFVTFLDAGGVGKRANPFESGANVALGIGPRLRLWYVPIAFDYSYLMVKDGTWTNTQNKPSFLFFLRIGEAFLSWQQPNSYPQPRCTTPRAVGKCCVGLGTLRAGCVLYWLQVYSFSILHQDKTSSVPVWKRRLLNAFMVKSKSNNCIFDCLALHH